MENLRSLPVVVRFTPTPLSPFTRNIDRLGPPISLCVYNALRHKFADSNGSDYGRMIPFRGYETYGHAVCPSNRWLKKGKSENLIWIANFSFFFFFGGGRGYETNVERSRRKSRFLISVRNKFQQLGNAINFERILLNT